MKNWLIGKDPDAEKDCRQEAKGLTEDEMVAWHHWVEGHKFEYVPGVGDGQGSLVFCSPWGCKESDMLWLDMLLRGCSICKPVWEPVCDFSQSFFSLPCLLHLQPWTPCLILIRWLQDRVFARLGSRVILIMFMPLKLGPAFLPTHCSGSLN